MSTRNTANARVSPRDEVREASRAPKPAANALATPMKSAVTQSTLWWSA